MSELRTNAIIFICTASMVGYGCGIRLAGTAQLKAISNLLAEAEATPTPTATATSDPGPARLNLTTFQPADVVVGKSSFNDAGSYNADNELNGCGYGSVTIVNEMLYYPDYCNHRVVGYNSVPSVNGVLANFVLGQNNSFTTNNSGRTAGLFFNPQALYTINGKFMLTDFSNGRVLIFNTPPTGQASADYVFGQNNFTAYSDNTDSSHLYYPESAFMVGTKLIVSDSGNGRVLVWNDWAASGSGSPADMVIGKPNMTSWSGGFLNRPASAWSDGTKLFVADSGRGKLAVWNTFPTPGVNNAAAAPDFEIGTGGVGVARDTFNSPYSVTSNGLELFLSEQGNRRVLIWNNLPTSSASLPDVVLGQGDFVHKAKNDDLQNGVDQNTPTARTMAQPSGLYVDSHRLIVGDQQNGRIMIFNAR